jgi:lysophospholipase L1-like esterase
MNNNRYLLHNVIELEPASTGGKFLRRFPADVRQSLSPLGRLVAEESAGCELRFVTEARNTRVAVSSQPSALAPHELHNQDIFIFKGAFFHSHLRLKPGRINYLQLSDIVGDVETNFAGLKPEVRNTDYFSADVWRVLFGRYAAIFHELETFGYPVRAPLAAEIPKRRILCYGSSITNGASPTLYHLSYVQQAARHLKADVFNQGLSGACWCEPEMAKYLAARSDWDIITLELGVNMRGVFTIEEFAARSRHLIQTIHAAHPDKPVFVVTIYPNAQSPQNTTQRSIEQERQLAFDDILRAIVADIKNPNIHLIEGCDILTDYSGMTKDLIHPGDFGHIQMGFNLANAIKQKVDS